MVAPERFNSSQVPRNIDNLCHYIDNLSDENYERYEDWRIENRDNFVREYNDLLDEHHMMQYMNSSGLESDSDEDSEQEGSDDESDGMGSDNESDGMDSDNESEDMGSDEENTLVDSDDEYEVARQSVIEEPQPEDEYDVSEDEIEYSVISDEESDYDSEEDIDADYTEWLYPYLSSSHVLL